MEAQGCGPIKGRPRASWGGAPRERPAGIAAVIAAGGCASGEGGADDVGPTGQRERGDAEAVRARWQVGRAGCAAGSGPVRGVGGRGRGEGVGGWARAVRDSTRAHELRAGARR